MTLSRHAFLRHRIGTDIWGLESGDFSKMECYRARKNQDNSASWR
jgi:hypothetical protein